ncbi:MAG TPA: PIG-L deacetylase family protein [Pirellulales bacterium]|jgi:LmbE family N-acetylglucosaminyl deacetylase|nr:PIG-L deacetylase family protein [Pirellulales bacterium]
MPSASLKLLILGAHPDDAEFHAGGLATLYRQQGATVKVVSVTNGAAGHQHSFGPELTARRRAEAAEAAAVIGASSAVWDFPDGRLEPTLRLRTCIIRELRLFAPDLVLTHRTNDYHPDHRAVGQAVQDASYLVTVPAALPEVPHLPRDPVVVYMSDRFTRPRPLEPDVAIDVEPVLDTIIEMLACHQSQVFDWLPYNRGAGDQVPADMATRRKWLTEWFQQRLAEQADRFREALIRCYGQQRGQTIRYAEAFEASEHAGPLDAAARERLFGPILRGNAEVGMMNAE